MELKAGENVVWNAVPGELVLLNADTGTYYALDEIGADIWRMLMDSISVEDVKNCMAELYDAEMDMISDDVDNLIADLLRNQLLVQEKANG